MNLYRVGILVVTLGFNLSANAGEAHICISKIMQIDKQEQLSDETVFKCAGIKNGKNSFTINEFAQNNWQIISLDEGQAVYKASVPESYHQIVIQKP